MHEKQIMCVVDKVNFSRQHFYIMKMLKL